MVRTLLAFLFLGLLFNAPLAGEVYELKAKKIRVNKKNADILPEVELRPQREFSERKNEPRYRSDHAKKFTASFGNGESLSVAFAVDEKQGTEKGFDLLYIDLDGSGDLAKGKKLTGRSKLRGVSYLDTEFPAFEVKIPNGEEAVEFPVQARFSTQKGNPNEASLYLIPLCVMEGQVAFGEKQQKMIVFDTNCNGIFGEAGTLRGAVASGDKVWIGPGSPKVEDAYVEAFPLGRYYLFENEYYEIKITDSSKVEIAKAEVPLGKIKVNNPGFILELVQGGNVLYVGSEKETEVAVPAGSYKVNNASFRRRYKGAIWELQGRPGTFNEQFTVKEDDATEIKVGPPLKVMIRGSARQVGSGLNASLQFSLGGSSGETYQYLLKGGKKIDLPEIQIKAPGGKAVESGKFEYG